jgi:hypothetical protein
MEFECRASTKMPKRALMKGTVFYRGIFRAGLPYSGEDEAFYEYLRKNGCGPVISDAQGVGTWHAQVGTLAVHGSAFARFAKMR